MTDALHILCFDVVKISEPEYEVLKKCLLNKAGHDFHLARDLAIELMQAQAKSPDLTSIARICGANFTVSLSSSN